VRKIFCLEQITLTFVDESVVSQFFYPDSYDICDKVLEDLFEVHTCHSGYENDPDYGLHSHLTVPNAQAQKFVACGF
jgi:hypothetical protein